MAVAFDANSTADVTSNAVTTRDLTTLTVGSGSNRALVVQIAWSANPGTVTVANWNQTGTPQALTLIPGATAGATNFTQLWGLVNPTAGAKTLRVTWTNAADVCINAVSWTGVDQGGGATSFPHGTGATGTSITPTATVTSAVDDAVMAVFAVDQGVNSVNNTQTFIDNVPANMSAGGNRAAGAASVVLTATSTTSGANWAAAGTSIKAAGAGETITMDKWFRPGTDPKFQKMGMVPSGTIGIKA